VCCYRLILTDREVLGLNCQAIVAGSELFLTEEERIAQHSASLGLGGDRREGNSSRKCEKDLFEHLYYYIISASPEHSGFWGFGVLGFW
jgi:hypothetical protein